MRFVTHCHSGWGWIPAYAVGNLAPAKAEQVKQKRIKTGSLPFVTPTPDIFTPVVQSLPVQPCQEIAMEDATMQGDASPSADASATKDKPKPVTAPSDATAKRQKVTVREVPKGCALQAAAKDGNCMYHAVGDGLRWLKEQPKAFHRLDLRARVAEHLARHKEDYEPAWSSDRRPGPDGTALPDWDAFVAQVALPGKYSGEAESGSLSSLLTPIGRSVPMARPSTRMSWQFILLISVLILCSLKASIPRTSQALSLIPMVGSLLVASVRLAPIPLLKGRLGLGCRRPVLPSLVGPSPGHGACLLHALAPPAQLLFASLSWCEKAILSRLHVAARLLSVSLTHWLKSAVPGPDVARGAHHLCSGFRQAMPGAVYAIQV